MGTEEKGFSVRFVETYLQADFLFLVTMVVFSSRYRRGEEEPSQGNFHAEQMEEGRELTASTISQLSSAQNNLYTKVAHFGVTYSESLHSTSQFGLNAFHLLNGHR